MGPGLPVRSGMESKATSELQFGGRLDADFVFRGHKV